MKRLIWQAIRLNLVMLLALLAAAASVPRAWAQTPPPINPPQPVTAAPTPGGAAGEELFKVTANGASTYRADDLARSREEALEAARRDAVEQVSGVIISSESEMKNFDLVKDEVLTRTQGYVRRSTVVKEGKDGPMYAVTIEAEVSKGAFLKEMNDSLEALYRRVGKPRVMLVIKETLPVNPDQATPNSKLSVAEKEIRRLLLAQGFAFVDPRVVTRAQMSTLQAKGKDLDPQALQQLGATTQAEILIIGEARASDKGMLSKFHRVQADLSLDVLRTDNGQVMASDVYTGPPVLHINLGTAAITALQKAAQEETPKLMQQVTYQWLKDKNEGARVEMTVHNASFSDLVNLRKSLANSVRGVKKVTQRSYSQGTALLELETKDATDRVAESLNDTKFDGFALEIVDVTPTSLVVNLKKN